MMPVKSSPPVVVVSGRYWWSAVRVVAHAVVWKGGVFQFQKTEDDGNNFRFLSK